MTDDPHPDAGAGPAEGAAGETLTGRTADGGAGADGGRLLCEPYLLDPDAAGVHVVWHTEPPGTAQVVLVGPAVVGMTGREARDAATGAGASGAGWRRFDARTHRLTRTREDADSRVPGRTYSEVTPRPVYRHLARVTGLAAGRTPYRVVSIDDQGRSTVTPAYSLAPAVPPGRGVRLLLTSDHQLARMTPANLAKVAETVGVCLDGVLMAGDMVNVPDRASDWFDSAAGPAFFAAMTGRAATIAGRTYRGAELLQHTPLFPAIGNHEVMGRQSRAGSLTSQFAHPRPAEWDVTTYEELFPHPRSEAGGPRWWSRTIGNVHLVTLFVTGIWRPHVADGPSTFAEGAADLAHPERWGYGRFIFEPVHRGSAQYRWLARELTSEAARAARFRVVMFHHSSHGLGDNSTPAFTDPVQRVERDPATGAVTVVRYAYPLAEDYVLRDLEPLFSASGVHLVHTGHTHLWNRFRNAAGVNWLETSNVGNSYGAYDVTSGLSRPLPDGPDHVRQGDPGGLRPIVPTIAPLTDSAGTPLPYVASNDITVFSILDSAAGVVRSYRFDTREPDAPALLFDEFPLA
ncbi:metallophosphoesterase [Micromonospora sp. HM5-17]|uniref:metallophosphoesterase family protein n=1 Tax=Micromonospora sp. HM5-17 TaxID=2487710 RepID=UPI000F475A86|nr:metallophosphoesterase [Micromonospora sp. HM5-17]ROT29824.1 metallophosphoesterase [Micromonospora sp. HM5-17]